MKNNSALAFKQKKTGKGEKEEKGINYKETDLLALSLPGLVEKLIYIRGKEAAGEFLIWTFP